MMNRYPFWQDPNYTRWKRPPRPKVDPKLRAENWRLAIQAILREELPKAKSRARKGDGCVYIIAGAAHPGFKVGATRDFDNQRAMTLQKQFGAVSLVHHIVVRGDPFYLERALHFVFAEKRIKAEWYSLDSDDLSWLQELRSIDVPELARCVVGMIGPRVAKRYRLLLEA